MTTKPNSRDEVQGEELVISSLATSEALAKLLIEKGIISGAEFTAKLSAEKAICHALLQKRWPTANR